MHTNPVTVVTTCTIQPGNVNRARLALEANIKTVLREEPACHGIRVHDKKTHRVLIIGIAARLFLPAHICRRS